VIFVQAEIEAGQLLLNKLMVERITELEDEVCKLKHYNIKVYNYLMKGGKLDEPTL